ncbi:hypothetical protein C1H46_043518 [Malus baccata]|uniref:DUF3511 domain-containing protein n=1 Tax=Malus baccata TaxID=106549 RepID=A0A540K9V6_MALBA|nr:hypothetical protein C1H46_043518 [Malus baccata]
MEEIRYRSYAVGGCRNNLEMVNVRRLSENRTMYMGRPHFHPSWDPNPSMKTGQCNDLQLRIGGMKARTKRVSSTKSKSMKLWWKDPEIKRRGRVARYKLYGAEGKVKRSLKKGYRWFKRKCLEIVRTI